MPAPAPSLNPLGLFSLTVQNGSTVQAGSQSFNPGDVPAPPQYGSGTGAPTNYTAFNFGGQAAPDMQSDLNSPHSYVLAPGTPAPVVTPTPITTPTTGPGSGTGNPVHMGPQGKYVPASWGPVGRDNASGLNPADVGTGLTSLSAATTNNGEYNLFDSGQLGPGHMGIAGMKARELANTHASYTATKNTALSPSALSVPTTHLQFADTGPKSTTHAALPGGNMHSTPNSASPSRGAAFGALKADRSRGPYG
ncbi:MAG: hypothetical protein ACYDB1_01165 [Acidiferrobacteraceae bacterium]